MYQTTYEDDEGNESKPRKSRLKKIKASQVNKLKETEANQEVKTSARHRWKHWKQAKKT